MAKIRIYLEEPWQNWWEVSFDHYPLMYRGPNAVHAVHCYNLFDGWPWPEYIWCLDFMRQVDAELFAINVTRDPIYLADVCPLCNVYVPGIRLPRWNIHRGENRLWFPSRTYLEPWPPP